MKNHEIMYTVIVIAHPRLIHQSHICMYVYEHDPALLQYTNICTNIIVVIIISPFIFLNSTNRKKIIII